MLLSELISLVTAKLVGMGIIGHQFTFSLSAVCFTIAGFLAIKLTAFLILSGKVSRQEIGTLLAHSSGNEEKQKPAFVYGICAVLGIIMLAAAYTMAIRSCGTRQNDAPYPVSGAVGNNSSVLWDAGGDRLTGKSGKSKSKASCLFIPSDPGNCHPPVYVYGHQLSADLGSAVLLAPVSESQVPDNSAGIHVLDYGTRL